MSSRVLLVDSDLSELSSLESELSGQGYDLASAESCSRARSMIAESMGEYGVCLVDWEIPDGSATELVRWIHGQQLPATEIVLVSESLVHEEIQRGLDSGAYYFLTKPFDREQLRAIVRAAVQTSRLKRELETKIDEAGETLRALQRGNLRFRTPRQAELLAVQFGSAARDAQVGVALFELFLNSVEHGNLAIDYDEKGRLLAEGRLQAEILARLEQPAYRDRWVELDVARRSDSFDLLITDQGDGFDFARYLEFDRSRMFDSHGRGILMSRGALEIEYLGSGNRVRVDVPIDGEPPSPAD